MLRRFLQAILPRPARDRAKAHKLRGDILRQDWHLEEAAAAYRQALRIDPGYADVFVNLGVVEGALGRRDKAAEALRAAIELDPDMPEAHLNLGNLLQEQGRMDEAIRSYLDALRVAPSYVLARDNLAMLYRELGRLDEALACELAVAGPGPNAGVRIKRTLALPIAPKSAGEIDGIRVALLEDLTALLGTDLRLIDPLSEVGQTNFLLAYHGRNDRELQTLLAQVYLHACPGLGQVSSHCAAGGALRRRRRVGFLSRFFFNHSVGACYAGLINRLAAEGGIDVVLVCIGPVDRAALERDFPSVRELASAPLDLARAREEVAALRLDVLFYTDIGMDPLSYFLAFSRLAPVQCATLGHPVTSGIPAIDYFISSAPVEPPDAQSHYSEKLVVLDSLPAYVVRPALPTPLKRRAAFDLPEDRRLYVCPLMLQKLHPDFDAVLADILRRDPGGEVVLFRDMRNEHWHRMVQRRLQETIPSVYERIRFLPWLSLEDLMNVLMLADVALDTFHFGASTTTFLVLGTGTPIVTLPAAHARGRMTLALYRRMGIEDCIAANPAHYAELAVRIARDRAYHDALRTKIRERSGMLYEDSRFVSEMTRVLTTLERPLTPQDS